MLFAQLAILQTILRDTQPTQHIEIAHPDNLKLAFHKVASFHPHYLKCTPQTYHHPVYRFRSWPMQTTSPSHPYLHKKIVWTQQNNNLILNPDKTTCTVFTLDHAEYMSNLDLTIKIDCYTWATTF